jgi:hypothetical protein
MYDLLYILRKRLLERAGRKGAPSPKYGLHVCQRERSLLSASVIAPL